MAVNNGLYNTLFGECEHADKLLDILDIDREVFGRYRDCYLNADGTKIIVLTRCGGANRQDFQIVFDEIQKHPNYLNNYDDIDDNTYCYFEFKVPVLYLLQTRPLATGKEPMTVGQKFDKEGELLKINDPGAISRAEKIAQSIQSQIDSNPNGGIIYIGDPDISKKQK